MKPERSLLVGFVANKAILQIDVLFDKNPNCRKGEDPKKKEKSSNKKKESMGKIRHWYVLNSSNVDPNFTKHTSVLIFILNEKYTY